MNTRRNEYRQPIGPQVVGWTPRPLPPRSAMVGRYCRVEPLAVERHATDLYQAYCEAADGRDWTYLFVGPFPDLAGYRDYLIKATSGNDPLHYAIIDLASGKPVGTAALMRIDPTHGVIEVGHITYAQRLQRTPAATEAMCLLMRRVFDDLGYRRYEWKCDSNNERSRAAAVRLGFQFEGIFRQAIVYKGRSRDTAWYSIIDSEWPATRKGFEQWLSPANFDAAGKQIERLSTLIAHSRA